MSREKKKINGVYEDDVLLMGSSEEKLKEFKLRLMKLFEMTKFGPMYLLGKSTDLDC